MPIGILKEVDCFGHAWYPLQIINTIVEGVKEDEHAPTGAQRLDNREAAYASVPSKSMQYIQERPASAVLLVRIPGSTLV